MPEPVGSPGSVSTASTTTFEIPVARTREPPASRRVWRRRLLTYLAATAFFLLAFSGAFHAIVLHPESRLLNGFGFSDAVGGLRSYWAASFQHQNPLTFKHDALSGAPQGDNNPNVAALTLANGGLQTAFLWATHGLLGWVGAWNAYFVLTVLASSLAMFAFLDWLGCNFVAALFGGYVFGFNAYAIERAFAGHVGLLANWVFVLLLATLLWSRGRRLLPSSAAIGGTIALAFYNSAYLGLFAAFMALVYFAVELITDPGARKRSRTAALVVASFFISLVALAPVLVLYARNRSAVGGAAGHPLAQIYDYSVGGLRYLRPSPRNPLVHWLSGEHQSRYLVEHTVFFGYTTITLAITGAVLLARRDTWLRESEARRRTAVYVVVLALAGFLMSLGPRIQLGPLGLATTPAWLLAHATTFWRVYARFGVLVGFALSIAAALALSSLAKRRGRAWSFLPAIALAAVVLELLPGNMGALDTTARPKWVQWLAAHPHGIVASYPFFLGLNPAATLITEDYWFQTLDHHPRFQSVGPLLTSRPEAIRFLAQDVGQPLAARILATEDVRYAVLHDDVYRAQEQKPPTPNPRYFTLQARFGPVRIYSIRAPKTSISQAVDDNQVAIARLQGQQGAGVLTGRGFNRPELYKRAASAWMIQNGILEIVNSGGPKRVELKGVAFSNGLPRLLLLRDNWGRLVGRQVIYPYDVHLRFPPFEIPPGRSTLRLTAYPGAWEVGPTDPRKASVFLSGLTTDPLPTWTPVPS
jgi:hypothetical protein